MPPEITQKKTIVRLGQRRCDQLLQKLPNHFFRQGLFKHLLESQARGRRRQVGISKILTPNTASRDNFKKYLSEI